MMFFWNCSLPFWETSKCIQWRLCWLLLFDVIERRCDWSNLIVVGRVLLRSTALRSQWRSCLEIWVCQEGCWM